jgi:hypothetical protein
MSHATGAVEAIDRILNRGGNDGTVLAEVVTVLHERLYPWAGILFRGEHDWELGPSSGGERPADTVLTPIRWEGEEVARLAVAGAAPDPALLELVATRISSHCANRRSAT